MTIGVGIVGMGFMGRTHAAACAAAAASGLRCQFVAAADPDPARLIGGASQEGNIDRTDLEVDQLLAATHHYTSIESMLADPAVHAVCICTHTPAHVENAIAALKAGKHVLVEKPLALASSEAERLLPVADTAAGICMPAMCMRFWPGWQWLHDRIMDGRYGAVRSATFRRLASRPGWADFYQDTGRTGGALFDLHVHDADFIHWCFGPPDDVVTTGTVHHLTAAYRYRRGPSLVTAEGGWDYHHGFPFQMCYTVQFDKVTADFELGREEPLLLLRDGRADPVPLENTTGWNGVFAAFISAIAAGDPPPVTVGEAIEVIRLLERERQAGLRTSVD